MSLICTYPIQAGHAWPRILDALRTVQPGAPPVPTDPVRKDLGTWETTIQGLTSAQELHFKFVLGDPSITVR